MAPYDNNRYNRDSRQMRNPERSRNMRNSERPGRPPGRRRMSPEQRRRNADMKASGVAVLLFFAVVLIVSLILLVGPRSKVSEIEKRALAEFPVFSFANYFSGDFTSGVTTFYDDTVIARDTFKNAGNNIKAAFGIKPKDQAEFIGNVARAPEAATTAEAENNDTQKPDGEGSGDSKEGSAEKATAEPETEDDVNSKDYALEVADATMEDGILVVFQDGHYRALVLTGDVDGTLYAESVNRVTEAVGKDVNVYFVPIPLACEFYMPANYSEYATDQAGTFRKVAKQMDDSVKFVEICDTLNNHNEEEIYLRTDHHWAPLGAYYAAREFTKAAGVPFADLENDYDRIVNEGYVGTMYAFTGSANILNDPEDFVYYIGTNRYIVDYYDENFNYQWTGDLFFDTDVSSSYLSFLGSDNIIAKITTDVKNGRKLIVVKDSYGNAEVPFLTHSFEEIYVVDQRYFKLNLINFIKTQGITDVLFTHNNTCLTGAEAELLDSIVNGYTDVPIIDTAPKAELPKEASGAKADSDTEETTADNSDEAAGSEAGAGETTAAGTDSD